jgi:hypothetical protein
VRDPLAALRSAPDATERRRGSLAAVAGTIDDPDGNGIDDRFALVSDGQLALVRLDGRLDVQDAIARLRRDPAVLYAEPNDTVRAARTPDDPRFRELYGLDNTGQTGGTPDADIDAPEAWDISVGSADVVVGDADIMFVATAGGAASDNDVTPSFPASYEAASVVAVTATDHDDVLASFSNFGATSVDLGAPGVRILSTTPGNTYSVFSGTSMATPHVSGAAALILSVNPGLDTAAVKALLLDSGDAVPSLDGITVSGRRLNAASALQQAAPYE